MSLRDVIEHVHIQVPVVSSDMLKVVLSSHNDKRIIQQRIVRALVPITFRKYCLDLEKCDASESPNQCCTVFIYEGAISVCEAIDTALHVPSCPVMDLWWILFTGGQEETSLTGKDLRKMMKRDEEREEMKGFCDSLSSTESPCSLNDNTKIWICSS
uniref:Uncharacterized protein n=1 Tax=Setaria digitata TaxID=48799 RepID=A0A915PTE4_9BILA